MVAPTAANRSKGRTPSHSAHAAQPRDSSTSVSPRSNTTACTATARVSTRLRAVDAPDWFRAALAVPCTEGQVDVGGGSVHYLAWGDPGRRGLVFVHGGGAHAHWWTHVAATFSRRYRVLAVDLSGHGDSDHRDTYSLEQWTDEVVAVAEQGGVAGLPVIVGHSM